MKHPLKNESRGGYQLSDYSSRPVRTPDKQSYSRLHYDYSSPSRRISGYTNSPLRSNIINQRSYTPTGNLYNYKRSPGTPTSSKDASIGLKSSSRYGLIRSSNHSNSSSRSPSQKMIYVNTDSFRKRFKPDASPLYTEGYKSRLDLTPTRTRGLSRNASGKSFNDPGTTKKEIKKFSSKLVDDIYSSLDFNAKSKFLISQNQRKPEIKKETTFFAGNSFSKNSTKFGKSDLESVIRTKDPIKMGKISDLYPEKSLDLFKSTSRSPIPSKRKYEEGFSSRSKLRTHTPTYTYKKDPTNWRQKLLDQYSSKNNSNVPYSIGIPRKSGIETSSKRSTSPNFITSFTTHKSSTPLVEIKSGRRYQPRSTTYQNEISDSSTHENSITRTSQNQFTTNTTTTTSTTKDTIHNLNDILPKKEENNSSPGSRRRYNESGSINLLNKRLDNSKSPTPERGSMIKKNRGVNLGRDELLTMIDDNIKSRGRNESGKFNEFNNKSTSSDIFGSEIPTKNSIIMKNTNNDINFQEPSKIKTDIQYKTHQKSLKSSITDPNISFSNNVHHQERNLVSPTISSTDNQNKGGYQINSSYQNYSINTTPSRPLSRQFSTVERKTYLADNSSSQISYSMNSSKNSDIPDLNKSHIQEKRVYKYNSKPLTDKKAILANFQTGNTTFSKDPQKFHEASLKLFPSESKIKLKNRNDESLNRVETKKPSLVESRLSKDQLFQKKSSRVQADIDKILGQKLIVDGKIPPRSSSSVDKLRTIKTLIDQKTSKILVDNSNFRNRKSPITKSHNNDDTVSLVGTNPTKDRKVKYNYKPKTTNKSTLEEDVFGLRRSVEISSSEFSFYEKICSKDYIDFDKYSHFNTFKKQLNKQLVKSHMISQAFMYQNKELPPKNNLDKFSTSKNLEFN